MPHAELKMTSPLNDFAALAELANPEIRPILESARTCIRSLHPDATEIIWIRQRIVSFGFGPRKMTDHYVYLQINARHLNLGFYHADQLDDPDGVLEGSGLKLRHTKLFHLRDVERESVVTLVRRAVQERKTNLMKP